MMKERIKKREKNQLKNSLKDSKIINEGRLKSRYFFLDMKRLEFILNGEIWYKM